MGTIIGNSIAVGAQLRSKLNQKPITFTLTSTGTGTGVSILRLWTSEDMLIAVDGSAKFYDDSAGTINEGTQRTVVAGATRTFYLKCPSGTANLIFADALKVLRWGDNTADGWASSTNAASIGGSIELLTNLTLLYINGSNTLTGSVAGLTNLTFLRVLGSNTLTGSVAGLTNLTYLNVTGYNTLTGSVAGLTNLTYLYVLGSNTLEFPNVTNIKGLCYLYIHTTVILSSANVNQILADFWLNKDEPKSRNERTIDIRGSLSSGAPTGQGITDAANLAAYRSPNNDPTKALWTVLTR